jgi:hypothetical protein
MSRNALKRSLTVGALVLAVLAVLTVPAAVAGATLHAGLPADPAGVTVAEATTPPDAAAQAAPVVEPAAPAEPAAAAPSSPQRTSGGASSAARERTMARVLASSQETRKPAAKKASVKHATAPSEGEQARSILRSLIAEHPILEGTIVRIGHTPGTYQAVAYYTEGEIVISPSHTASLSRILNHEIWHVIDWRDNHHIDWGESVPPRR